MMPTISTIVPCFNASKGIRATLESVLTQRDSILEIIAIDDGSTDNTGSMIEHDFPNVRLVRAPVKGKPGKRSGKRAGIRRVAAAVRRKRGFSFPMDPWMRRSAGALEEMSQASKMLDRRAVADCWSNFRTGRLHWSRAWAITVLGGQN